MIRRFFNVCDCLSVGYSTNQRVDRALRRGVAAVLAALLCGCGGPAEPLPMPPPAPSPPPELLACPDPAPTPPRPPRVVTAQRLSQAYAALDAAYAAEHARANLCAARLAGAARVLRERP